MSDTWTRDMPVSVLTNDDGLSTRAANALWYRFKQETPLDALLRMSRRDILTQWMMGKKSLALMEKVLEEHGLRLDEPKVACARCRSLGKRLATLQSEIAEHKQKHADALASCPSS